MAKRLQNYYEALGISEDASLQAIKTAFDGRMRALEAQGADPTDKERLAEENLLKAALAVLSNPEKRDRYDEQLARSQLKEEQVSHLKPWIAAGVVAVLLVGSLAYYAVHRAGVRERIRLEEERIALEAERAKVRAAAEQASAIEAENSMLTAQERREAEERRRMEHERANYNEQSRWDEHQARIEENARRYRDANARREQDWAEQRERSAAEQERRAAQFAVERNKEYLRTLEAEEQAARNARYMRALEEENARRAREAAAAEAANTPLDPRVRRKPDPPKDPSKDSK